MSKDLEWRINKAYDLPELPGVYFLYCTATERGYIGATKNIKRRVSDHLRDMTISVNHHSMAKDYLKFGKESIKIVVLEVDEKANLFYLEIKWNLKLWRWGISLYNKEQAKRHRSWKKWHPNIG